MSSKILNRKPLASVSLANSLKSASVSGEEARGQEGKRARNIPSIEVRDRAKQSELRKLEFIPQSGRTNVKRSLRGKLLSERTVSPLRASEDLRCELAKQSRSNQESLATQSAQYISLKQLYPRENEGKGRELGFAPTSEPDTLKLVEDAKRQFDDAKRRATAILEEAKKQAERVKSESFEEGYQEGFAQGEEAGKIKVKEESDSLVKFFQNAIEEVSSLKSSILKEMEPEIVQLSLMLAEKLVLNSFQIHPEAIASIIKNLIKNFEDEEEIKILVNPSALPILEEYLQPEVMATSATDEVVGERSEQFLDIIKSESNPPYQRGLGGCKLKIEGDEKISEGGCLIVTDTKILDAQIETRILEAVNLVSGEW